MTLMERFEVLVSRLQGCHNPDCLVCKENQNHIAVIKEALKLADQDAASRGQA